MLAASAPPPPPPPSGNGDKRKAPSSSGSKPKRTRRRRVKELKPGTRFQATEGLTEYPAVVVDPRFTSYWGPEWDIRTREISASDPESVRFMWDDTHEEMVTHYLSRRQTPIEPPVPPPPSAAGVVPQEDEGSVDLTAGETLEDYIEEDGQASTAGPWQDIYYEDNPDWTGPNLD